MNPSRAVLDVSAVPESVLDHRSTVWWGNVFLMAIETMMFALLVAAYFYVRPNFPVWLPPAVNGPVGTYQPAPLLTMANLNLAAIFASCATMAWADWSALHHRRSAVIYALTLSIGLGVVACWLRWHEFGALRFRWDDNAYASIVWTLLGLHLLHLIVGTLENVTMLTWVSVKGLDDKHARDVRVAALYWYWVGAIWLPLYGIIFLGPRLEP